MTDLHASFATWLAEAAPGDPPRDLALHASTCPECLAGAAGLDALASVDPGMAPMPPQYVLGASRTTGATSALRAVAGVTALGLLVLAVLVGANAVVGEARPDGDAAVEPGGANEGILGAAGGAAFTPAFESTPSADPSGSPEGADPSDHASPTPAATSSPAPVAGPADPAPDPTSVVTVPAGTSRPTPAATDPTPAPTSAPPTTPSPSSPPSPTPTPTTPSPSPSPSRSPSPSPSPSPTSDSSPSPSPSESETSGTSAASCSNGTDDDGDMLADDLDPGCLLGSRESDL